MRFGEMIKNARRNRFSQQTLGGQIGVWGTYIGQIEKGERVPSDERCLQLAEALELDPTKLLLAAYQERAQTKETRQLFKQMTKLLTDPAISLAIERKLLDGQIIRALSEPGVQQALKKKECRQALSDIANAGDRNISELVQIVTKLSPQQWEAVLSTAKAFAGIT